jgi:type II secretory pathway pseudopilin PulG
VPVGDVKPGAVCAERQKHMTRLGFVVPRFAAAFGRRCSRLRAEDGFGLMELLIAMVILNVALMVLVISFSSAGVALARASRVSTGGVIADSQMERFRGMTFAWIGVDTSAATDATYKADVACVTDSTCSNTAPTAGASACQSGGTVYTQFPLNCVPSQSITGPDGRTYRLDTYVRNIQSVVIGNPRSTKLVTIVVRNPTANNAVLAREESDFDYCTALPDPSGTGALC